jgi:hypothetical protein
MKKSGFLPLVLIMLLVIMIVPAVAFGRTNEVAHDLTLETKTFAQEEVGAQLSVEMVAVNPVEPIRTIFPIITIVGFLFLALFKYKSAIRPVVFPGREYRAAVKKEGIGRHVAAPPWVLVR